MASPAPTSFTSAFQRDSFQAGGIELAVLRGRPNGPVVIVIHELAGVTDSTVALAERIAGGGFTVVMPVLLDRPRAHPSSGQLLRNLGTVCVAREFGAFARHASRPIVDWLRALATSEYERAGRAGPGVGVVGMCFSGGFALAMVVDPLVEAAVASQPALPFALPGLRSDLGVSRVDLDTLRQRAGEGFCVRALRYQRDPISPGVRHRRLKAALPTTDAVEIPSRDPRDHSVLTNAIDAPAGSPLAIALQETIEYLSVRLHPPDPRDPPAPPAGAGPRRRRRSAPDEATDEATGSMGS
jgi:dienelactone hydrolase